MCSLEAKVFMELFSGDAAQDAPARPDAVAQQRFCQKFVRLQGTRKDACAAEGVSSRMVFLFVCFLKLTFALELQTCSLYRLLLMPDSFTSTKKISARPTNTAALPATSF